MQCFLVIPKLLLSIAFLLLLLKKLIWCALRCAGLEEILETSSPEDCNETKCSPASIEWIRDNLPISKFGEFMQRFCEVEEDFVCAVCLSAFREEDEIRELCNCCHIFHKNCLDKWLDHYHSTCPMCRSSLLSGIVETEANEEESRWVVERICYLFAEDLAITSSLNLQ